MITVRPRTGARASLWPRPVPVPRRRAGLAWQAAWLALVLAPAAPSYAAVSPPVSAPAPPAAAAATPLPDAPPPTPPTPPTPPAPPAPSSSASPPSASSLPPAPPTAAADAAALTADDQTLSQLQNQIPAASDDRSLAVVGAQAAEIQSRASAVAVARSHALTALNRAASRGSLRGAAAAQAAAQRTALQAQLRQARAIAARAAATFTLVAERRREGFSERVLQQSPSPLSPEFWSGLRDTVGPDLARLGNLGAEAIEVADDADEPRGLLALAGGLLVAFGVAWPGRRLLERVGEAAVARRGRRGRFGRSAAALWMTVVDVGTPVLAAVVVRLAAAWGGLFSDAAADLASAAVVAIGWTAAILALGQALVTHRQPPRRLLTVSDAVSTRTRRLLAVVAPVTAAGYLLSKLNYIVGASVSATIASNGGVALAYALLAAAVLITASRGRQATAPDADAPPSPAWTLISLGLGAAIVVTVGAVVMGFTTLATLVSGQVFWFALLGAASFLLLRFAEDFAAWLFMPSGWASRLLNGVFSLRRSTVAQLGVLLAAAAQIAILLAAVSLALTPFGDSGRLLASHLGQVGQAVRLGSATLSPRAVLSGIAVFAIGLGLVNLIRGWFVRRYLPVTGWDLGVRNSVSTGLLYLGVVVTALSALAAMGLGFQQIALVASALSVGIGFGLQQVVQNFVSGVILLIERPVKVGDWVSVGGLEGDIRRIRVRATEIETFDHTTVIVPNSDLITKQVQNKTLGDPRGRVQLELSIASPADAERARELILKIAADQADVLGDPVPAVYIDSLAAAGAVNFKCYLFVPSPRDAMRVRSALYFAVLAAFQSEGIAFNGAAGPQNLVVEAGPKLTELLASPRKATGPPRRKGSPA
jgi:potassium-dependent mechanosensitive channel